MYHLIEKMDFTEEKARSLFELADLKIVGDVYMLHNEYWGAPEAGRKYYLFALTSPWFLVEVYGLGFVKIGWKKNVLNIDWSRTNFRIIVTDDDVTKELTIVHAWSYPKAIEYLTRLGQSLKGIHNVV